MNKRGPPPTSSADKAERLGITDQKGEEKDDADLLAKIRKRMERCMEWEADNRKSGLAALQFKALNQWSPEDAQQRNIDRRPCLTIDRLNPLIRQVTNDQRMNRPAINVSPVGDKGDPEAAKMYRGMIRAIERESSADIAYDTAFESAVSNGWGYIRINTEWENEESFDQTIVIKRVRNPFTVYGDPNSQEPDGADWKFAIVTEIVPEDDFKEEWPDAQVVPFDVGGTGEKFKNWTTKDGVRVAEYFEVVEETRTYVQLANGHEGWKDQLSEDVEHDIVNERESKDRKVKWWRVTAVEVLERHEWLGKWIPIVPVIGNEIDIEGRVILYGLIKPGMGAQQLFNYWRTKQAEAIALVPNAPYIMEEGQGEGHEEEWRNANRTASSVLFYKGTSVGGRPAPPPQRQPFAQIPEGFVNAAEGAAMDIMATTGIRFDVQADHRSVDERSGKALREFNRPQDLGSSHYMDNLARSLKQIGRQLVDLIPKYYDEKRVITILREDDKEEQITLDPHAPQAYKETQGPTGKVKIFNPNEGRYGVTVTIGPSFATKRVEAAESIMEFGKAYPHAAPLIMDLAAKYMDWDGSEEMANRLAKAVPPQLLTPDQKDVPPQVQALMQHMQEQIRQQAQQLQQALAALNDKGADRKIAEEKIARDFEAKVLGILQKSEDAGQRLMVEQAKMIMDAFKTESGANREDARTVHSEAREDQRAKDQPKEGKSAKTR